MRVPLLTPIECPNCRQSIPRIRLFLRTAWSRWRCDGCGALLGIDTRRRFLAMIPWIAILAFLLLVLRATSQGIVIALPILIGAAMLNFFILDRVRLHERAGFRCRDCGYDLHGQSDDRCPECGANFDPAALAAYEAGDRPPRSPPMSRWSVVVIVVVFGLLTVMVVAGVLRTRSVRNRAIGLPPGVPGPPGLVQPVPPPAGSITIEQEEQGEPGDRR